MFDYQQNFNEPTRQINSEEEYRQITQGLDLETWCRDAQRAKELEHGAQTPQEKEQYHKEAALAKSHLPKIMWQATFPEHRRKKDEAKANGLYIYDWDGIWDRSLEETLQGVIDKYKSEGKDFIQEEKVMLIHWTPSHHGIRLVCQADPELDIRGNQTRLAEHMGVPEDQQDLAVFDLSRTSYGVPYTQEWVKYINKEIFTYFNQEYSDRWSTVGGGAAGIGGTGPAPERGRFSGADKSEDWDAPENRPLLGAEDYQGIPYTDIIDRYWKLYHSGQTPVTKNRNTLTFELACNLRHICGFDRDLLDRVIPNYDNFPEAEKLQCIDSALKEKRGRMPVRLSTVLNSLRAENLDNTDLAQAISDQEEQDEMYFIHKMQALPLGIRDSLEGVKPSLGMPILIAIGPAIGALATNVRLKVHGKFNNLNLQAYIVGEAGSDKSEIGPVFEAWCWKILEDDRRGHEMEEAYEEEARRAKNAKQQPVNPHPCIRYQSLRTSNAMLLYRLKYANGQHLVSYSSESDLFSQNAHQSWADTSVLVRLAYDGDRYSSDYKSDSAVNGVIEHVKWNICMACTPDALFRSVRNYTNGEVTRLAIARTPDNTFAPYVAYELRSESAIANIHKVAEILMEMQGDVDLPELENRCLEWLEKIRLAKLKNDDRTGAQLRMRVAITAMRYTCCFMLCAYAEWLLENIDSKRGRHCKWTGDCKSALDFLKLHPNALEKQLPQFQTEEMLSNYDVIADYIQDNLEFYFKEKIDMAKSSNNYITGERTYHSDLDDFFTQLPDNFSMQDAKKVRGPEASYNAVKMMLKNWKNQGLIDSSERGKYVKINSVLP